MAVAIVATAAAFPSLPCLHGITSTLNLHFAAHEHHSFLVKIRITPHRILHPTLDTTNPRA